MRLKNLDLILVLSLVLANVAWTFLPVRPGMLGIILSLPLVFVLPGYALTEAFFRRRALEPLQRFMFSLALSLAAAILSGFILNLLPGGLNALSWVVILSGLTTFFSLIAYLRRRGLVVERRARAFHINISSSLLLGLAVVVAVLSVMYSTVGAAQQRLPGFTQLWILPPAHAAGANSCAVNVGVHSFESTTQTYHMVVTVNNVVVETLPLVSLASQHQWEQMIPINPRAGNNVVEVRLYRQAQPAVMYRNVHLTLHSSTNGNSSLCTY